MDPFGAVDLAGKAAQAFLRRARVTVDVNEDYDMFGDYRVKHFFFPVESPAQLTELRDQGERTVYSKPYEWVVRNHGLELGHTVFEFAIQAQNATVALLGGMPIIHRDLIETRGIAVVPPPAGGPLAGRYLGVNLDEGTIDCRDGDNLGAPPIPFRFSVERGTTEVFRVHAHTSEAVSWYLKLLFVVNGKRIEWDVERANGEEFVTYPYHYSGVTASYEWKTDHWDQVRR